ncbi:hypothetical protein BJ978_001305 [Agromyces terreus]|uniref:Uncharacterized protein n=1 Tax=Agromyces terreus TaxID=424795 RepID=A0A9X2KBI1_9MICO|nr:hypothetical protein [Agromyces terreus]MCP2370629.1 hypothetical protein [Agromyces terreus]
MIGTLLAVLVGAFVLALAIGTVVRLVRAPKGRRLRSAFAPLMGAGEVYQQLHTGQKGLQESVIESIQASESRPSRTDGDDDDEAGEREPGHDRGGREHDDDSGGREHDDHDGPGDHGHGHDVPR